MDYVVSASGLSKTYGRFKALDDFSISVPEGAIYGFVGRNGAGKTTFLKTICGLIAPDGGTYSLFGVSGGDRRILTVRGRVGAMVETPALYASMTARENMEQQCRILGLPATSRIDELLALVAMEPTGRKKVRHFSHGMRQKLGIAMVMLSDPSLVILDEPVNGLDPQGIIELRQLILTLNREHRVSFLISSHILDELSRLATHYGFIDHGHMIKEMTAGELEEACKKSMRVAVSDMTALAATLERMGLAFHRVSDTEADIYDPVGVTRLAAELMQHNCEILSCREQDANLEAYFIELLEGKADA